MTAHIVVVGASIAGLRAAEQLRKVGHDGPITVLGKEPQGPYNRPPLSKEMLAAPENLTVEDIHARLAFPRKAATADVDIRLACAAVMADFENRTVTTRDGESIAFDGLVVATGLRPRRIGAAGPTAGRHVLRTIEDCIGLRSEVGPGTRVVVVGAGFIGCEAAVTLSGIGATVTVVEPTARPMLRVVGEELGLAVQRHHEQAGIEFRVGSSVVAFKGDQRVTGVVLDSGEVLAADVVVESVGSVPNVEWLAGTGALDLSDGVLCDNSLRVVGFRAAVAAGDVARFPNPRFGNIPRRVEHWTMSNDTAKQAALTLHRELQGLEPDCADFVPMPSFWSDQGELRIQSIGVPAIADRVVIESGDPANLRGGLLAIYHAGPQVCGSISINLPASRQVEMRDAMQMVPMVR
ncbi:NAD(P)/FAD-dependent oxidoreductase [Arthrobacter sp. FW306-2-2C-D06B]|uniref:NAD(P)/FAD-dependent oxidoreductase n=1 Tax=Arthrobacter sp. FW306-2-2C-D06B TaxID=2879618 RepID=UPI001F28EBBF|nr:FAD-dependent oxidoreductase [Arthrobacter sp. FW306-2-2C-D06B]UKA60514.1 FAD-dependent oxidoreductase [Arthrobacter sp. FW306-2-2C-D06B]